MAHGKGRYEGVTERMMPMVEFLPRGVKVEVGEGESLYEAAQAAGVPLASSCSGQFVCGKCNVQVKSAPDTVSAQTDLERSLLEREKKPLSDRIGCRTYVQKDCQVTTTYW